MLSYQVLVKGYPLEEAKNLLVIEAEGNEFEIQFSKEGQFLV